MRPCRELAASLAQGGPGFRRTTATDADVTVACAATAGSATAEPGVGGAVALVDMWAATPLGSWAAGRFQGDRRPPAVRRLAKGLAGQHFPVALLVRNDPSAHSVNKILSKYLKVLFLI